MTSANERRVRRALEKFTRTGTPEQDMRGHHNPTRQKLAKVVDLVCERIHSFMNGHIT